MEGPTARVVLSGRGSMASVDGHRRLTQQFLSPGFLKGTGFLCDPTERKLRVGTGKSMTPVN